MGKNTTGHESLTVTSHAHGQAAIVHNQLEVDHSGSLGSRKCSGPQVGTCGNTSIDQGSRRAPPIARAGKLHERRAFKAGSKRGDFPGPQSKPIREFHLANVSGAQEGRISETDSRPLRSQQVHSMGALQDGRYHCRRETE